MGSVSPHPHAFGGIPQIMHTLEQQGYIADREVALSIHLSVVLHKPLLIEGAAGVGKTEVAKVMARAIDAALIRLQCYEAWTYTPRCTSGITSGRCSGSSSRRLRVAPWKRRSI